MSQETNSTVKTAAEDPTSVERTRSGCCYRPNVDILERDGDLYVVADVPGARSDSIDVKFEDGTLEIRAAVEPTASEGRSCLLQEYGVGDYYRSFQVSEAIDAGKITAEYADGVLTLRLPKAEAMKPRKITVETKSN
ncbi:MAG: Hsp20/alpha crystallin family protein [Planctomycetaceae bacterium]|nr:Hsp20/alpha crystallin family protein [Planctomycetaceae bacterium]